MKGLDVVTVPDMDYDRFLRDLAGFYDPQGSRFMRYYKNGYDPDRNSWVLDMDEPCVFEPFSHHPETETNYASITVEFDGVGFDCTLSPNFKYRYAVSPKGILYWMTTREDWSWKLEKGSIGAEELWVKL